LGGIPLIDKVCNYFIKKAGYNPDINLKLFKNNGLQNIEENIKNFKGKVPESIIKELEKAKNNKPMLEKLLACKFLASTLIPIALMGFVIPKFIFASSAKKIEEQKKKLQANKLNNTAYTPANFKNLSDFMNNKKVSFKGWISSAANLSTVNKMAITDGGYAAGRLGTARNKNEVIDISFKMAGMMFLNYVAPKYIQKILDKATNEATNLNVSLDPKVFENKELLQQIKNNTLKLPKGNSEKELLQFIDNNPNNVFVKIANELKQIKLLENGIRDPRNYIDIKELANLKDDIAKFAQKARLDVNNLEKFAQKAKMAKSLNILINIVLSSFLLAIALPKAQFAFRKLVTGSDLEPGLAPAKKEI